VDFSYQLLVVFVVLGVMLAALAYLKRAGLVTTTFGRTAASGRPRELRVVERVVVSTQHSLVLVEVNKTRMLICLSPGGSNVTVLQGDQQGCSV
jgi:flagellar biogenesis protein FliO